MSEHEHKYQRLSDVAVFCPSCGDVKAVQAFCPRPHYPTYPIYPTYPNWPNWWSPTPIWPTITYTGTGTLESETTFIGGANLAGSTLLDDNLTPVWTYKVEPDDPRPES